VEVDAAVSTFYIEPRLTYVLLPKKDKGPFVAGRLGAGLLIADYWATRVVERPSGFFVDSDGDTTFAFEVRPGVQLGFCGGKWVVGARSLRNVGVGRFQPPRRPAQRVPRRRVLHPAVLTECWTTVAAATPARRRRRRR
jgi:hypothetical protein